MADKLAYLGSPYTKYAAGLTAAYVDVAKIAARLIKSGLHIYSPITHLHPIARYGGLDPRDVTIWYPHNRQLMDRCDLLIVAQMDGWRESEGLTGEIEYFDGANKPIYDLDPESFKMKRRYLEAALAEQTTFLG